VKFSHGEFPGTWLIGDSSTQAKKNLFQSWSLLRLRAVGEGFPIPFTKPLKLHGTGLSSVSQSSAAARRASISLMSCPPLSLLVITTIP
jgi:hypothetical protein